MWGLNTDISVLSPTMSTDYMDHAYLDQTPSNSGNSVSDSKPICFILKSKIY